MKCLLDIDQETQRRIRLFKDALLAELRADLVGKTRTFEVLRWFEDEEGNPSHKLLSVEGKITEIELLPFGEFEYLYEYTEGGETWEGSYRGVPT